MTTPEPTAGQPPQRAAGDAGDADGAGARRLPVPLLLFALTIGSTSLAGTLSHLPADAPLWSWPAWRTGLQFSLPLMAILLSHELGHYIAARIHRVPASLPYFLPLPLPPIGTFGAVILMPGRIQRRDALFDIGAAGPLAGLAVALPVLAVGLHQSAVGPMTLDQPYLQEGHSLLYRAMLWLVKGPIPEGHDIFLSPTAFAGWVGLLVTMINLIPAVQLDGGHIAYALWGERQERYSRRARAALPALALLTSAAYTLEAYLHGRSGEGIEAQLYAGLPWLVWWVLLRFMARRQEREHPPTDDDALSPRRRVLARVTLGIFVLIFMPGWLREVVP